MLQNRLTPEGEIIKTSARGHWMGNRGLLHDSEKNIRRLFRLKAWITCLLEFKGRKRPVMEPGFYTELFSFDEATAFAAGHRPCAECRRADFNRFKELWITANPQFGLHIKSKIGEIDQILHAERMDASGRKMTYEALLKDLSDGVFIRHRSEPYVIKDQNLYLWTPFGYKKSDVLSKNTIVTVLTPKSIVNTFVAGYKPQIIID